MEKQASEDDQNLRDLHHSMDPSDQEERKLTKALTLRDLYTHLVKESGSSTSEAIDEKSSSTEWPKGEEGVSVENGEGKGVPIPKEMDSPSQLRITKPPSQDNSQHGSYDPSPRDMLNSEPTTASGASLAATPYEGSKSTETSPRKPKNLFSGIFRNPRKGSKGSPDNSASPSPTNMSPIISPTLSPREDEDAGPHNNNVSSVSSSPQRGGSSRNSSGSIETLPRSPMVSSRESGTSALLHSSAGKIQMVSRERTRKKDERKALKDAKKLEKLHRQEAEVLIDLVMKHAMVVPLKELVKDVPAVKVVASNTIDPTFICSGPTIKDEETVNEGSGATLRGVVEVGGRTISTYPFLPGRNKREGTPICDSYFAQVQRDGVIVLCIADGCGWGSRPREAAVKAKVALVDYIARHLPAMGETQAIADILVKGLGEAHYKVIEGKDDINLAGTTTILGGVVAPVEKSEGLFCFMFISVGDCKAFCRKSATGKIIDLTLGSRNNVSDAKDPGGRIGPHNKGGMPDFRNLRISYCIVEEGDILFLTSDGLSDNFDPEYQGLLPQDLGLPDEKWADVKDFDAAIKAKGLWSCSKMAQLVDTAAAEKECPVTPTLIVDTLVNYCEKLTLSSRDWLESTSTGKLPEDYRLYPGKMDHTTCMGVVVVPGSAGGSAAGLASATAARGSGTARKK